MSRSSPSPPAPNNVFPMMLEGTIAGLAAAVVATRVRDLDRMVSRHTKLEIAVDGEPQDIALVDLAVSTDRFVGARAIWDMSTIHELFLDESRTCQHRTVGHRGPAANNGSG